MLKETVIERKKDRPVFMLSEAADDVYFIVLMKGLCNIIGCFVQRPKEDVLMKKIFMTLSQDNKLPHYIMSCKNRFVYLIILTEKTSTS